ncbi:MAG: ABC transporter substrate-binding protein [Anaerolineaceae bacterium]|nr:ABC transporter substrate-binding protein [Anaerolineaceae bacterium]
MRSLFRYAFLLVLIFSLLLASCGTPAATEAPAEEPAAEEPAEETCGVVELQFWNPFTGPDGPYMGQMVDEFNAAHPDINVTMTSQGEYYTQLSTAAAADTLPDVAIVHADQVSTQAFRNVLRPIDDLVTEMGISGDDYPAGVWDAGEVAGHRYSIPLDIHPMTMFYNADLFAEAGFDAPPTTAEEFEAVAAAITSGDNKGFDLTGGFPVQQIFQQMLHQFGGSEFNADGTEATWNSEAGVQALQWMKDMQAAYSEPNLEVDAELNAFKTGTVGIVWNGIWQTTNVTGEGVEFDGRATSVPQIGPEMAVWAGSHQFTMPTHGTIDPCKDQAAAVFIKYMVENSVTWTNAGQIPASKAVRASDAFKAIEPQASIGASVEYAFFPPSVPGITDAFGPLGEAVGAVMNGTATDIQAALDDAATRANEILAQNAATYGEAPAP